MANRVATPGVYVIEKTSFAKSAISLPTAVPAFIGYTEKAVINGKSLINLPTPVRSLSEFETLYGMGPKHLFELSTSEEGDFDLEIDNKKYLLGLKSTRFFLYDSLRFYFANGGGLAFIVSTGTYSAPDGTVNGVTKSEILAGLQSIESQPDPTLIVIPDLMNLTAPSAVDIQQQMLAQSSKLQNRFALLDVFNGNVSRTFGKDDIVNIFRDKIGTNALAYGAAYYPFVQTSIVDSDELSFTNVINKELLIEILGIEAAQINSNQRKIDEINNELSKIQKEGIDPKGIHKTLKVVCPSYLILLDQMGAKLNILPPSGGVAGLIARVDDTRGVWKAPANEPILAVTAPVVRLTNEEQEDLNICVSGKSVNAIRYFPGEGCLVWGARTLDGNSQDYRYINVRRTLSYIEQSIKNAARAYVFEPNNSSTWVSIRASITAFLTGFWQSGGLAGGAVSDAFEVNVGLGTSMTSEDIIEGMLKVSVKVALLRPAEFIVITFEQRMQTS